MTGSSPRVDPDQITDKLLAAEWRHYAGYGWTDQQIADRLGVTLESVQKAAQRGRAA
ncbi:sigma-70 region 4 domain-containing protein [Gordonia sp. PP30]|uniref:sigma-70 region 4 domain-containing protein n=1 Tax=Gordonia sp. PP30 TaxID=2935861 RepID=UPI001FFF634C|nr:sigma-70 region 4 domain-containing protein [Gordonia sp. PP30]UQE73863.1 sigma-70 region 4 domain-containing protein [Gordonia sp. PP30]